MMPEAEHDEFLPEPRPARSTNICVLVATLVSAPILLFLTIWIALAPPTLGGSHGSQTVIRPGGEHAVQPTTTIATTKATIEPTKQSIIQSAGIPGASSYVASLGFPTSAFSSYYYLPDNAKPTQEPQPAIYDPILNLTFPYNLTNPDTIPDDDPDPIYFPEPTQILTDEEKEALLVTVSSKVAAIIDSDSTDSCGKCISALTVAKQAALLAPESVPDFMIELCQRYEFKTDERCEESFQASTFGQIWTQVLYFADVAGLDGHYICNALSSTFCPRPEVSPLDTTKLFTKPKPKNPKKHEPSGKRVKVLHLSDFHRKSAIPSHPDPCLNIEQLIRDTRLAQRLTALPVSVAGLTRSTLLFLKEISAFPPHFMVLSSAIRHMTWALQRCK